MKILTAIAACALALLVQANMAQARPVYLGNTVTLTNPDPVNWPYFGRQVAIDGDHALVLGENFVQPGSGELERHRIAWLYRRNGSTWGLVGPLAPPEVILAGDGFAPALAMHGGFAFTRLSESRFYRLQDGSYVREPIDRDSDGAHGPDAEFDGNRLLLGAAGCSWSGLVYERDSTGTWRRSNFLAGNGPPCGNALDGGPLDISGDDAVLFNEITDDPETRAPHARTYRPQSGAGWLPQLDVFAPAGATRFGPEVAVRGGRLYVAGSNESGTYVFDLAGANPGVPVDRLRPIDSYAGGGAAFSIEKSPDLILQSSRRGEAYEDWVLNVFQQRNGGYAHAAVLVGTTGEWARGRSDISGRDIIAGDSADLRLGNRVYIFRLPSSFTVPAIRQDNFESGSASAWTQTAGSNFAVVRRGGTRVLRQSDADVDARALLSNSDWTTQAIEADITLTRAPTEETRGVGLITRYQNPQNFYQAVIGTRGLWVSRMGSGRLSQIGIGHFTPEVGRTYRLRIESTVNFHRVYLDGVRYTNVTARGPTHGRAGLVTETSTADFDNVLVTPGPRTTLYASDFTTGNTANWSLSGPGVWTVRNGMLAQTSTAGDARALIGTPTDDQVVRARARLGAFGSGGTADKWFGLLARASNSSNYYYLSLRSSNALTLRKVVNGAITQLASRSFTVTRGAPYDLQLEAVGNRIRVRVNGALLVDVADSSLARGQPGLVTYRAAVDYDDFEAVQP